jgi:hypothetical protein
MRDFDVSSSMDSLCDSCNWLDAICMGFHTF